MPDLIGTKTLYIGYCGVIDSVGVGKIAGAFNQAINDQFDAVHLTFSSPGGCGFGRRISLPSHSELADTNYHPQHRHGCVGGDNNLCGGRLSDIMREFDFYDSPGSVASERAAYIASIQPRFGTSGRSSD